VTADELSKGHSVYRPGEPGDHLRAYRAREPSARTPRVLHLHHLTQRPVKRLLVSTSGDDKRCAESDRGRVRGRQLELLFGTDPNMSVVRLADPELLDLKSALLEPACHCGPFNTQSGW
jgi:hypothetical protein